ncbi:hypothetical protein KAX17_09525 [Candidatus Bipolaricaulota bacterium]|nr:hypothetical protein [Candidatus Bipolaricaulota bacterium]
MTDLAIRVENLSKRYRMGQYVGSGAQYKTLRESLTNAVSAPLRRLKYILQFEIRNLEVPIPNPHRGDISVDLLVRLLRQSGITQEEW